MSKRLYALLISFLFGSPAALGTVRFLNAQGVSNFDRASDTAVTVYGGFVGVDCGASGINTCDSCAGASFSNAGLPGGGCNRKRVQPGVTVSLSFVSDENDGYPVLLNSSGGLVARTNTVVTKGGTAAVNVTWGTLCGSVTGGSTTCAGGTSGVMTGSGYKLGIDTGSTNAIAGTSIALTFYAVSDISSGHATDFFAAQDCASADAQADAGACDFQLYPGDGKAWIEGVDVPSSFPNGKASLPFRYLRFLYETGSFAAINPGSPSEDIAFTGTPGANDFSLVQKYVGNLTNRTDENDPYYFLLASVDAACNVGFFTLSITDRAVSPSEVNGLLKDQFNCFIATAAYGSPWAQQVETLRLFRDRYLLPYSWGKSFVRWYYNTSPFYAEWIAQSDMARAVARAALWPVWALSALLVQFGWAGLGGPALLGAMALWALRNRRSR